jgi:hypothetical protein
MRGRCRLSTSRLFFLPNGFANYAVEARAVCGISGPELFTVPALRVVLAVSCVRGLRVRFAKVGLLISAVLLIGMAFMPLQSGAAVKTVDEFDSYVDNPALQAVWVVDNAKDTVILRTPGFSTSTQAMKIEYHNGADPWYSAVTTTFGAVQDWSDYRSVGCRYIGMYGDDDPFGNSGEKFFVRIYDEWGGFVDGPKISNATKTYEWIEYMVDISSWGNRGNVAAVSFVLEPEDYGSGQLYVDRLHLDTWPPVLDDCEVYLDSAELQNYWVASTNAASYLMVAPTAQGDPGEGQQYMAFDYDCGLAPYNADLTLTFDFKEDWSNFSTLSLMYRARPDPWNSMESFRVVLEDEWGGYFEGPLVVEATQCDGGGEFYCPWNEYLMNFESWGGKAYVQKVILRIQPNTYGDGRFFIDYLVVNGEQVPARNVSWGSLKATYR